MLEVLDREMNVGLVFGGWGRRGYIKALGEYFYIWDALGSFFPFSWCCRNMYHMVYNTWH